MNMQLFRYLTVVQAEQNAIIERQKISLKYEVKAPNTGFCRIFSSYYLGVNPFLQL